MKLTTESVVDLKSKHIPVLSEIDGRIQHWTMRHGQHFSSGLENRLIMIEKKLESLAKKSLPK